MLAGSGTHICRVVVDGGEGDPAAVGGEDRVLAAGEGRRPLRLGGRAGGHVRDAQTVPGGLDDALSVGRPVGGRRPCPVDGRDGADLAGGQVQDVPAPSPLGNYAHVVRY
ncbi:hypothetical protein OG911_22725 [Streptomyces sp. NBC_00208]|uniref:hypothetical protein n=1 Tax=Streptomyces sp. NBC_00208 TaxID=2975681 RepID=UPI002E281AE4|nr:hypothetical protein [Streptomyces sp. NBC_00208]